MPRVSVIIPTYNRKDYVQEAIDSVLAQTYTDYEIIVVDDGSTDGTGEALQARYRDRIRYLWQENRGESLARNRAVDLAQGDLVALLDSDDRWMPRKLAAQISRLEMDFKNVLVACQALLIDSAGKSLNAPPIGKNLAHNDLERDSLILRNPLVCSTVLLRRSYLQRAGGFDPEIKYGEDWDLWLRVSELGRFNFVSEPLALLRQHSNTQSYLPRPSSIERKFRDHIRILENAFIRRPERSTDVKLRRRSLARPHAEAAFSYYAWGHWLEAMRHLREAVQLDPTTWQDPIKLNEMVIYYGKSLIDTERTPNLERLLAYVDGMVEHWPKDVMMPCNMRNLTLAQLFSEAAYWAHTTGDKTIAREFAWKAFVNDRSLLRNRGMVKRFLHDVLYFQRLI